MSLSLTSRERLGALAVLAISLLLTGFGWWWRTRTEAEARVMAVTITPLPTEAPHETATRKALHDSLRKDSVRHAKARRKATQYRRSADRIPAYRSRQPLDEPVPTE